MAKMPKFSTSSSVSSSRTVRAPRVRGTDRIFPIPATKEVKPAKVDDVKEFKAPKLDIGKPMKADKLPAPKPFKPKMDGKGLK